MSVNLATTQAELVAALATIDGLRVVPHDARQVSPPFALVPLPVDGSYRVTKGQLIGVTWELWVLVNRTDARTANDRLLEYLEVTGARSIPAAILAGPPTEPGPTFDGYTGCDSIDVVGFEVEAVTFQGVQYVGAGFQVSVL